MRTKTVRVLFGFLVLGISAVALNLSSPLCASAQTKEVYSATVIASEGMVGSSGRVSIGIAGYSSADERTKLLTAFKKSSEDGMVLLRTMSKGYVNVEGQAGRKIQAVFVRERQDGRELIIISEHMASKLETSTGVKAENHPVAVIHLRFGADLAPVSGEVFPAVKLAVTPEGYVDVQTDSSNQITMIDLKRQ
jgi:hypothetical protein